MKIPVVVVDDDEDCRYLVKRAIRSSGHDVEFVEFEAGDHFLAVYSDQESRLKNIGEPPPPVLLLLDINMPRLNGFEVLDSLKDMIEPEGRTIVVTMYSSSSHAEDRNDSMKYSFVKEYLVKPITSQQLGDIIEKYCLAES